MRLDPKKNPNRHPHRNNTVVVVVVVEAWMLIQYWSSSKTLSVLRFLFIPSVCSMKGKKFGPQIRYGGGTDNVTS